MGDSPALRAAIDLLHLPSEVHRIREEPLPGGIPLLLRVAAGEDKALARAMELTNRPEDVVQEAAGFFIEQILFAPNAGSYRVLGASRRTSAHELRGNMALLIRWLHPDLDSGEERSIFIGRVTAAWDNLKTKERRQSYDQAHPLTKHKQSLRQRGNGSQRSTAGGKRPRKFRAALARPNRGESRVQLLETYLFNRPGPVRRALIALLGGMRQ